jgi:hypothetical protein
MHLTTHFHLVPRLRIRGTIHYLPHVLSWHGAWGQLFTSTCVENKLGMRFKLHPQILPQYLHVSSKHKGTIHIGESVE